MKPVEIAILGFGTVGSGAYRILNEHARAIARRAACPIEVKKILVRDYFSPFVRIPEGLKYFCITTTI